MVKLADTLDLGSNAKSVQVQVLSSVPNVMVYKSFLIDRFFTPMRMIEKRRTIC